MDRDTHKFSPIHPELNELAATELVDYGGVLLAGAVDANEAARIRTDRPIEGITELYRAWPSFEHAIGQFILAQDIDDVRISFERQTARQKGISQGAHNQSGVTMAAPLSGEADVYIGDSVFSVARSGRTSPPTMGWHYQPGDVIVMREDLQEVNGKRLHKPKPHMHQIGVSFYPRMLMIVRLSMPGIWTKYHRRAVS